MAVDERRFAVLRGGDLVVAHGDAPLELERHVDLGAEMVRVEPVEELRQRLLGEAGGDGVRGVLVALVERVGAGLFQQLAERPHLVFVQTV